MPSRLMGADEAGTQARLKTLRAEVCDPKTVEYGGRIVKTMGDGALVEFPSAVDGVQHAIDVQGELARRNAGEPEGRRIARRIGVNLGDVIVDGDDIHGDDVSVAARLEALAEPGVCINTNDFWDGPGCRYTIAGGVFEEAADEWGSERGRDGLRRLAHYEPWMKRSPVEALPARCTKSR